MAQSSWPWDGTAVGDAALVAPYDEQEWDDNERMEFNSGGNVGVLPNPYNLNRMQVTERAAGANMSVDVDTGAALVYGKRFKNTATVNLTIAANASGNPRIDRVVVVWNRQAIAYTGVTPNIDPKTCRVAVLQGTPGAVPVAPALTQNSATVYMIPLAQVAVANGAVTITDSEITDEREFAETPSGMVLLEEQVLTGTAASVTFSDIPIGFRHLRLLCQARHDDPGARSLCVRFNGDAGANYNFVVMQWRAAVAITNLAGQNFIELGELDGLGSAANYASGYTVDIPNYSGSVFYKSVLAQGQMADIGTSGNLYAYLSTGWWQNTDPINEVLLYPDILLGGVNFIAGSVFSLYALSK